uniref:NADH-ubiquinone oxidoreductase chain 1 n=1 Tax=Hebesoma violentum TaxID=1410563 RepID=A0A0C4JU55_9BILA|nr:NADH dehydrogenase subunit 1 [Hebesoma violentum]
MRVLVDVVVVVSVAFLSVAFFTLLDRKVLGYGQMRKGPFKVFVGGVIQPLLDGVKLFLKGWINVSGLGGVEVFLGACVVFSMMILSWFVVLGLSGSFETTASLLVVLLLSGVGVVGMLSVGLFSGSVYSVLGVLRSVAQMVSYEVVMGLGLIFVFMGVWSVGSIKGMGWFLGIFWCVVMMIVVVMEVNRTPVDFLEGESELVSGGVTELGGLVFALLFMAEYGLMGFYSVLISILAVGKMSVVFVVFLIYSFSWVRL